MEIQLTIIAILLVIIIFQLNKITRIMASAEETLDEAVSIINELLTIIEEHQAGTGDLTSEEVTAKMEPLKERINRIANPGT